MNAWRSPWSKGVSKRSCRTLSQKNELQPNWWWGMKAACNTHKLKNQQTARQHNICILMESIPSSLFSLSHNTCCKEYPKLLIFLTIYRVIQDERSIFLEMIVSVIVRKKYIWTCVLTRNRNRDTAVWIYKYRRAVNGITYC